MTWANQVRVLNLQFESFKATIGQGLINLFTPVLQLVNKLIAKLMVLADAFKEFTELITGNKSDTSSGLSDAADSAQNLADNTSNIESAAKKATKAMKSLMSFDEINKLSKPTDSDSSSTGNADDALAGIDFGSLSEGETVIDEVDNKFVKLFENIKNLCEPAITSLKRLKDEGLARLGDFSSKALEDFWNNFLVPVGTWTLGTGFPSFIDTLNDGLMKTDFNAINDSLNNLWDSLAPFAIKVGEGLLWFWSEVLVPLGTWTLSEVVPRFLDSIALGIDILSIAIEAFRPLFEWFWDNVLKPLSEWAADKFLETWDEILEGITIFSTWCGDNQGTITTMTGIVTAFFVAWKVTELLAFIQTSGGVIGALKALATALFGSTAAKIADKVATDLLVVANAKDFVLSIVNGTKALVLQAQQWVINTAAKYADEAALAGVTVKEVIWQSLMSTSIAQMAIKAAAWVKETALKVADTVAQLAMNAATVAWNAVCAIATAATTAFGAAVAFLTSPIGIAVVAIAGIIAIGVLLYKNWDTIRAKASEVWKVVQEKFQAFSTYISNIFSKDWSKSFGGFGDIINSFLHVTEDSWKSIRNIFSSIITFVQGVFTGNWKKAWTGVKDFFKSIFDSLVSIAKAPINLIIGLINSMLSNIFSGINNVVNTINGISFKVPDWVPGIGGKQIGGFNLPTHPAPKIPYLAEGGFVERNTPQLAMIGDNRHYGEIVAPENKLLEMAKLAASMSGGSPELLNKIISLLETLISLVQGGDDIVLMVDSEELARAVMTGTLKLKRRHTTVEVTI